MQWVRSPCGDHTKLINDKNAYQYQNTHTNCAPCRQVSALDSNREPNKSVVISYLSVKAARTSIFLVFIFRRKYMIVTVI